MISGVSGYSGYSSYSSYSSALSSKSTASSNSSSGGCASGQSKLQEKLFSLLDSNGDGSVAKDELSTALANAKESDSGITLDIDELFAQLDANSDGSIDLDETAALTPPPPPPPAGGFGGDSEELFSALDADGDGSISQDELGSLFSQAGSGEQGDSGSTTASGDDVYARLAAALLKQYESSAGTYEARVGSQLSTAA
ncbi:XopAW family type III secretion system calcium-binding effector [Pseudomonas solani]|uniref:XopAW family type III secretion system calcium-binding effector n=1 Tax=Pseudomonas solani TaxID=2731552 RepID=UPI003F4AA678